MAGIHAVAVVANDGRHHRVLRLGLAIPDRPYLMGDDGGVIARLLAIAVSILLGVLGRSLRPKAQVPAA
jgi:hypothetical protein